MMAMIRGAAAPDVEILIAVSRRTISACYRPFLGDAAVDGFINAGLADAYVTENIDGCDILLMDGAIVGYSVCRGDLIDLMMLDFPHQRHGLGTLLLQHAERKLFQSYNEIRLESFEGNDPANAFYRKHAWQELCRYLDPESRVRKIEFGKSS